MSNIVCKREFTLTGFSLRIELNYLKYKDHSLNAISGKYVDHKN